MENRRNSFGSATGTTGAVSFGPVSSTACCFLALEGVKSVSSSEEFSFGCSCEVDGCHLFVFELTISITGFETFVYRVCVSLTIVSSSEVSSDLSSSPGNDQVIVLVDGEGVILFVEVEDLHQVTVTTNTVSSTTLGNTQSLDSFGSSGSDLGCLEEFDLSHVGCFEPYELIIALFGDFVYPLRSLC